MILYSSPSPSWRPLDSGIADRLANCPAQFAGDSDVHIRNSRATRIRNIAKDRSGGRLSHEHRTCCCNEKQYKKGNHLSLYCLRHILSKLCVEPTCMLPVQHVCYFFEMHQFVALYLSLVKDYFHIFSFCRKGVITKHKLPLQGGFHAPGGTRRSAWSIAMSSTCAIFNPRSLHPRLSRPLNRLHHGHKNLFGADSSDPRLNSRHPFLIWPREKLRRKNC